MNIMWQDSTLDKLVQDGQLKSYKYQPIDYAVNSVRENVQHQKLILEFPNGFKLEINAEEFTLIYGK